VRHERGLGGFTSPGGRATATLGTVAGELPLVETGPMASGYEYKVVELREGMIGGKMSGDKLEKVLNDHGKQGWQLKAITAVEVKGRIGPGGVEGVLVTFERSK
jgi:hypothetical protein